ncbi:MAG: MBL fold metallo-hydrolase [Ignavibacteria bacterium]|nr:MBL fold metallo-hydrolase [Ignavibacteria bacterium]
MKKVFIISSLLIMLLLSGCFALRVTMNNIGDAITYSPEKIPNKITNPVKDSVKLSALWIGHSSVLIQIYDKVIILDPFFQDRLGGLVVRRKEPGLDLRNLSQLDLVLISHSHMDHLSFSSLDDIAERFPERDLIFPMGVEYYLPDYDLNLIRADVTKSQGGEYIGDPIYSNGMKITPVYALHPGGRYLFDVYTWKVQGATGYVINYKDVCVYFAGDTGYDDKAFKKIGDTFNIDLAFIPVGPCRHCDSPSFWFHTSSIEALRVFEDLKADYMIPIHYGTIRYFSDPDYPLHAMEEILDKPELNYSHLTNKVKILKEGE